MGRILIPIYLMNAGVLERPLLYLSPAVEGRKDDYVDLMLEVSRTGAWTPWISFFLEMIATSCNSADATLRALESLREDFRQRVSQAGSSARLMTIVDALFITPVLTIPQVAARIGVTYPAAKNSVDRLLELGIIKERRPHSNPKRFVSMPIVHLSEGRPPR